MCKGAINCNILNKVQFIQLQYLGYDFQFQKVSERIKKARKEKKMNHTTGKKSFAQLLNKMVMSLMF